MTQTARDQEPECRFCGLRYAMHYVTKIQDTVGRWHRVWGCLHCDHTTYIPEMMEEDHAR